MSSPEAPLLEQLSANSVPYRDPLAVLDWRALSADRYWLPPEAISLHGLDEFEALSDAARMRLSQHEFLAFAHSAIALERAFLQSTARRLRRAEPDAEYAFLLHEMREEAGHSLMFLRLAAASGLAAPDWRDALPRLARPYSRFVPGDVAYWFMMVVAQDVPDKLHRFVRRHGGPQTSPFIRQLISLHMLDASRHLAYARRRLEMAMEGRGRAVARIMPALFNVLFNRFVHGFFWPQAELYERAGLGDGRAWRRAAARNPHRREFVLRLLAPTMRLLSHQGISVRLR
ncbi:MAG: diiron oxygenase [Burkholderiales bacterium]|nr:diiron oxygenase [Burkholderiales bacterium]